MPRIKDNPMRRTCTTILTASLIAGATIVSAAPPTPVVAVPGYAPMPSAVGCSESRYPFDAQHPWLHGYYQETPAYAGFHAFRPYNYKHVFAQSQLAAEWGGSPTAPYSHQSGRMNAQAK
jgi:hypothetical protein